MLLKKVIIRNVKTYSPEVTINFDSKINLIVGPNGKGKSNLFEILQGVINNIIFRHVTIQQNPQRRDPNSGNYKIPFTLQYDNVDVNNISQNILDRHFKHPEKSASAALRFLVTQQDIDVTTTLLVQRDKLKDFLKKQVIGSEELQNLLHNLNPAADYGFLIGKEVELEVGEGGGSATIANLAEFEHDQRHSAGEFCDILRYLNAFHELSAITPIVDVSPLSRYIGPHRAIGQLPPVTQVDLSAAGNYENAYSKGINQNKENAPSLVDGSFNRLSYLHSTKQTKIINEYKKYLKEFLGINLSIKRVKELPNKVEYELTYTRDGKIPLKLSSGEKEFFNLITGLVLSGIKNGIILIDEPELHLHTNWQVTILRLMRQLADEFNLQFLIISHSPKLINIDTLAQLYRVDMEKPTYSKVTEPNPTVLATNKSKDLIAFTNITNSEKIFFSDEVILVEGIADLIVFSELIEKLKEAHKVNKEIAVIQVGSKNNLLKFREFLAVWKIKNYIVGDLDFLKEYLAYEMSKASMTNEKKRLNILSVEAAKVISFSKNKLKEILCDKESKDREFLFDLVENGGTSFDQDFINRLEEFRKYLITERASVVKKGKMTAQLEKYLDNVAHSHGVLILRKGELEDYFTKYHGDKVDNAQEIAKNIDLSLLDSEINTFLKRIVK